MVRGFLSTALGIAFVVLPSINVQPANLEPQFTLEDYFTGHSVAKGVFNSPIARTRREFDVFLFGKWDGKTLTLREDFVYADGEKDQKTWVFVKKGEGRYIGTREDVVGETEVTITGTTALFSYDVLIPRKGKKPIKLHFSDRMDLDENGLLLNRAKVSKFGFPIGKVAVNFLKGKNLVKVPQPDL